MEKDNLEILFEDIRGKFELVLEGHAVLHKEIKDTREQMDKRFDLVDFKMETLNQKIDEVDARLSAKIDDVETRLNAKIDDVETRLTGKIDAVAADLKAHREDTEAHPKLYHVREP